MRGRLAALLVAVTLVASCSWFKEEESYDDFTAEQLYAIAQDDMANGRWEAAIEVLRELEARFPFGVYAEQAQLDTIFVYYQSEQTGLALAAADRFIKLHPAHPSVDYAYYLKGLVSFNEDNSLWGRLMGQDDLSDRDASLIRDAMTSFEEVYTLFPDSQYAAESKKRVRYLLAALARHEIAVANYYYSRDAHVAVVNRAKTVIENYASTPSVEEALALMMFSYMKMGFTDLATDTRRVMELNFPESEYLTMEVGDANFANSYSAAAEDDDESWYDSFKNLFSDDEEEAPPPTSG